MAILQPLYMQLDAYTLLVYFGPFNSGDETAPAQVWAYPYYSWQFTGYAPNGISQPNVPISRNRRVTIFGSNDPGTVDMASCWGPIFFMDAIPDGMNNRMGDPIRDGSGDQRFRYLKIVASGDVNSVGPDCGVMLLAYRMFGPRK